MTTSSKLLKPFAVGANSSHFDGKFARNTTFVPTDPLFSSQWHNIGTASVDINIIEAWDYYTGKGIKFGVFDDGIDNDHVDLAANYEASRHVVVGIIFDDPTIYNSGDAHGTSVAGLIAARQGNDQGGVGGSFEGWLTGVDIFGPGGDTYLFAAMNEQDRFDLTNHSWGWVGPFADNRLDAYWSTFFSGLDDAAASGRAGLGTIQMVAAGNDREGADNANTSNFTSSRFVNAIAAISNDGQVSWYSNPGASLLVAAPSNGGTLGITTTDYTGSVGYSSGNYTSTFGGTSAATPIASGVVGLMLEANSDLGYRDVMEILAITAKQIGSPDGSGEALNIRPWQFNSATNWNNGGMHFSHDYGFGLIDAFGAVKLAESWNLQQTFANEGMVSASNNTTGSVPDSNAAGLSRSVDLTPSNGTLITIEAIEVQINWSTAHTFAGDLMIELVSPSGMTSYLLDRSASSSDLDDWIFTTRAHLGELATGIWTVRVTDQVSGDRGTVSSVSIRAYGSNDVNDNYYYTDEFSTVSQSEPARQILNDTDGGNDTINAAALSAPVSIDLNESRTSTLGSASFTIASGIVIENVIGGWSNDTIVGNDESNSLLGNAGDDTIVGGGGNDTITGGSGSDVVDGGEGFDIYFLHATWAVVDWFVSGVEVTFDFLGSPLETDIVSNVEYFIDSLGVELSFDGLATGATVDSLAPFLVSQTPADNTLAVSTSTNITLNFSEAVRAGTGNIEIYSAANGIWRSIAVSSPEVIVSSSQVTINPAVDLSAGTAYYVNIGSNVLFDLAGNSFVGISGSSEFNFTTISGNFLDGNELANRLNGTSGDDIINGFSGNDTINGNGGDDMIDGGAGNDQLNGGTHGLIGDTITYQTAGSAVVVTLASTRAQKTGGSGSDVISGFENLIGSSFDDRLTGSRAGNTIEGGEGNDVLTGGAGADKLWGGDGADVFDFNTVKDSGNTSVTHDIIMDFQQGPNMDRIDIGTVDASSALNKNNSFIFVGAVSQFGTSSDGEIRYAPEGDMTVIYFDTDRDSTAEFQIALNGLYTLTSADFVL